MAQLIDSAEIAIQDEILPPEELLYNNDTRGWLAHYITFAKKYGIGIKVCALL